MTDEADLVGGIIADVGRSVDRLAQFLHAVSAEVLPDYSHLLAKLRDISVVSAVPHAEGCFDLAVRLPSGEVERHVVPGWDVDWCAGDVGGHPDGVSEERLDDDGNLASIGRDLMSSILDIDALITGHIEAVLFRVNRIDCELLSLFPDCESRIMDQVTHDVYSAIHDGIVEEEARLAREAMKLCLAIPHSARAASATAAARSAARRSLVDALREAIPLLSEEEISMAVGEARAQAVLES